MSIHQWTSTLVLTTSVLLVAGFSPVLVLACSTSTVHAQSVEQRDQPAQPSGQGGAMPGQGGMEGRRGAQEGMVQMT